jgi:fluoroquinolone transport system ATP-binding protein
VQPAVRNISFDVAEGEIFGFLGPSGAGKSTTQKILIRLLKEFEGEITVLGRDLRAWGTDYFEQVGVSFELPNHYQKLTALENLRLFAALYRGKTEDPLAQLSMVGLAEDANTRVGKFSKGMQMRLNFVRALLHRPKLLFLDEPTSGLDPVNAANIKTIIRERQRQGATVFLTTHDMHVAEALCDRVALIVDGEIKLIDSPRTLKLQHGRRTVQVEFGVNGHTEQRCFPLDTLGVNDDFLSVIRRYPVETIHTQEASLEQIFIAVTGRSLT